VNLGQVLGERIGVDDRTDLGLDNETLIRSVGAVVEPHEHLQAPPPDPLLQPDLDNPA